MAIAAEIIAQSAATAARNHAPGRSAAAGFHLAQARSYAPHALVDDKLVVLDGSHYLERISAKCDADERKYLQHLFCRMEAAETEIDYRDIKQREQNADN